MSKFTSVAQSVIIHNALKAKMQAYARKGIQSTLEVKMFESEEFSRLYSFCLACSAVGKIMNNNNVNISECEKFAMMDSVLKGNEDLIAWNEDDECVLKVDNHWKLFDENF